MKKIQNLAAGFLIIAVIILAGISILGVWDVFTEDVITKSFETLGLLAGVAVIIMVAGHFVGTHQELNADASLAAPEVNPIFTEIRRSTVSVLIAALALLALLGILSIWEVVGKEVLHKSISSIGIIAFSALVVVGTCLDREHHKLMKQNISGGAILLVIIVGWIFLQFLF